MISVDGNDFIWLEDPIYVNGKKVLSAYANGQLVYPRQGANLIKIYGEQKRTYTKTFDTVDRESNEWPNRPDAFAPGYFYIWPYTFTYSVDIRFVMVLNMGGEMKESIHKSAVGYFPVSNPDQLLPPFRKKYNKFATTDPFMHGPDDDPDLLNIYCNNPDYLDDVTYGSIAIYNDASSRLNTYEFLIKINVTPFTMIPRCKAVYYNNNERIEDEFTASNSSLSGMSAVNGIYRFESSQYDYLTKPKKLGDSIFEAHIYAGENTSLPGSVAIRNAETYISPTSTSYAYLNATYNRTRYDSSDGSTTQKTITAKVFPHTVAIAPVTKILYMGKNRDAPESMKHVYESDLE